MPTHRTASSGGGTQTVLEELGQTQSRLVDPGRVARRLPDRIHGKATVSAPTPTNTRARESGKTHGPRKGIADLLIKGAIVPLEPDHNIPLYRSVFLLALKKTGDWRPIINLRPLNSMYVRPQRFRMETLHQIVPTLEIDSLAVTIVLKDAYLHVPMHPSSQRFLSFQ